jgi:hypothetical protein
MLADRDEHLSLPGRRWGTSPPQCLIAPLGPLGGSFSSSVARIFPCP